MHTLPKLTFLDHIKQGKDSSFSACCIVYFLLRMTMYRITGRWINLPQPKETHHVLCPFHCAYHAIAPVKEYHRCSVCNWIQYGNPNCTRCLSCDHSFSTNGAECLICGSERTPLGYELVADASSGKSIVIPYYDREEP